MTDLSGKIREAPLHKDNRDKTKNRVTEWRRRKDRC